MAVIAFLENVARQVTRASNGPCFFAWPLRRTGLGGHVLFTLDQIQWPLACEKWDPFCDTKLLDVRSYNPHITSGSMAVPGKSKEDPQSVDKAAFGAPLSNSKRHRNQNGPPFCRWSLSGFWTLLLDLPFWGAWAATSKAGCLNNNRRSNHYLNYATRQHNCHTFASNRSRQGSMIYFWPRQEANSPHLERKTLS